MNARVRVVLPLGLAQTLAWGSTYYLPAILAAPIARDLGITTGEVFGAFSLALLVTAVLGPVAGRRIDRHGGRDVLALSSILFAAGLGVLALADGLLLLWAGWFVIGVGMALGLYEAAFATLTGIFGREARSAISGITLLAGFASTVCWPITGWFEVEFGWRGTCVAWASLHLLLGLPVNRLLLPIGTQALPENNASSFPAVAGKAMALLAFVFAVTWFTSTAMAAHLPRLLQESGLSPAAAIATAALIGPAQVGARFFEFTLLRRLHPLTTAKLATVSHPLGALGLVVAGAPASTLFTVLHGAGNGVLTIAKGTLPLAVFGPHGYGQRQGMLMVPARFVQAFAPFIFALLIDAYGNGALAFTAVLGLLAYGALSLLKLTIRQSYEAAP